jgi:hypothetical protein
MDFVDDLYAGTPKDKTGQYSNSYAWNIARSAIERGVDPFLAAGLSMNESNLGKADPGNPFQVMVQNRAGDVHGKAIDDRAAQIYADKVYPMQNELRGIGQQVHAIQNPGFLRKVMNYVAGAQDPSALQSRASELESNIAGASRDSSIQATVDLAMSRLANMMQKYPDLKTALRSYRSENPKYANDKIGQDYANRVMSYTKSFKENEAYRKMVQSILAGE